jgi:hypothetical protein
MFSLRDISVSHGGEYDNDSLTGCCHAIALMMEAVSTAETSVNFYETASVTFQKTVILASFSHLRNLNPYHFH